MNNQNNNASTDIEAELRASMGAIGADLLANPELAEECAKELIEFSKHSSRRAAVSSSVGGARPFADLVKPLPGTNEIPAVEVAKLALNRGNPLYKTSYQVIAHEGQPIVVECKDPRAAEAHIKIYADGDVLRLDNKYDQALVHNQVAIVDYLRTHNFLPARSASPVGDGGGESDTKLLTDLYNLVGDFQDGVENPLWEAGNRLYTLLQAHVPGEALQKQLDRLDSLVSQYDSLKSEWDENLRTSAPAPVAPVGGGAEGKRLTLGQSKQDILNSADAIERVGFGWEARLLRSLADEVEDLQDEQGAFHDAADSSEKQIQKLEKEIAAALRTQSGGGAPTYGLLANKVADWLMSFAPVVFEDIRGEEAQKVSAFGYAEDLIETCSAQSAALPSGDGQGKEADLCACCTADECLQEGCCQKEFFRSPAYDELRRNNPDKFIQDPE